MATTKTTRSRAKKQPTALKSINPRTGEVLREIPTTPVAEVKELVDQARKVQPEWASISPEGRAHHMTEVRYRIYDLLDEIVETVSQEAGKPRQEALAHDVFPPIFMLANLEKLAPKALKTQKVGGLKAAIVAGVQSRIEWRPFGVVGAITPWNYPIANCFLGFLSALYAGNTVVVKPSEVTPACGELVRKILDPLPAGVATVIQGGGDVGAALVDAPVDKVSFIGSPRTGRLICEAAAKHLTPVVMELGGMDPAIICEDADLDVAASGIAWGAFFNAGQTCCSAERVFVMDSVADEFKEKLLAKLEQVKYGGDDAEVGSLTFKNQLDVVERHVQDATEKGATVLFGGPGVGPKNSNGSLWHAPTVLENVTEDMDVVKEESFGPILTIKTVRDEEEAIRRANEGVNLTASVWTNSKKRAEAIGARLRAGTVGHNDHGTQAAMPWAPWGGVGESGYGRLSGELGIREFTVPTHLALSVNPKMKKAFWYPYDSNARDLFTALSKAYGSRSLGDRLSGAGEVVGSALKVLKSRL